MSEIRVLPLSSRAHLSKEQVDALMRTYVRVFAQAGEPGFPELADRLDDLAPLELAEAIGDLLWGSS